MPTATMTAMTSDVAVSYHDTVSILQVLDHLARTPFDRAEWYGLLAQFGKHPHIVMAELEGKPAALPLVRSESGLRSLDHWFSFAWRPLADPNPAGDALLRAIASDLRGQAPLVTCD